jgi:hypothetical protein
MISFNGTTWTEPEETHTYYEKFSELYGAHIQTPACDKCGKVTCYVVEDAHFFDKLNPDTKRNELAAKPKRAGVATISRGLPIFAFQDALFLLMRICDSCGAFFAGKDCGRDTTDEKTMLEERARKAFPPQLYEAWQTTFNRGWYAGLKEREDLAAKANRSKNASRYAPKKGKEQLI